MKIEQGKAYRRRDGEKVVITEKRLHGADMPWRGSDDIWRHPCGVATAPMFDLIAEWPDEDDTPKTWGEMTDAEKINSATMEALEYIDEAFDSALAQRMRDELGIKPETKREKVTRVGFRHNNKWHFLERDCRATHRITFDTLDGEPIPDSIRMEKIK